MFVPVLNQPASWSRRACSAAASMITCACSDLAASSSNTERWTTSVSAPALVRSTPSRVSSSSVKVPSETPSAPAASSSRITEPKRPCDLVVRAERQLVLADPHRLGAGLVDTAGQQREVDRHRQRHAPSHACRHPAVQWTVGSQRQVPDHLESVGEACRIGQDAVHQPARDDVGQHRRIEVVPRRQRVGGRLVEQEIETCAGVVDEAREREAQRPGVAIVVDAGVGPVRHRHLDHDPSAERRREAAGAEQSSDGHVRRRELDDLRGELVVASHPERHVVGQIGQFPLRRQRPARRRR